jgi:hypothetical protein
MHITGWKSILGWTGVLGANLGLILGMSLGFSGPAQAATAKSFSCALAWDPGIPRATGTLSATGVPTDLVIHGGTGMTVRTIYFFTGPMTPSAAPAPYRSTPKVFDGHLWAGSTMNPVPYVDYGNQIGAVAISAKAGTVTTWKANFSVWPTPLPKAPNAVCTTLSGSS